MRAQSLNDMGKKNINWVLQEITTINSLWNL